VLRKTPSIKGPPDEFCPYGMTVEDIYYYFTSGDVYKGKPTHAKTTLREDNKRFTTTVEKQGLLETREAQALGQFTPLQRASMRFAIGVFMHEIGHVLGLDHPPNWDSPDRLPSVTVSPYAGQGRQWPSSRDIEAITRRAVLEDSWRRFLEYNARK